MTFPILGGNGAVAGYSIDNSLRFNDNDSSKLERTFSAGDQTDWTLSCWVKRGNLGNNQVIFGRQNVADGANIGKILFDSNNKIKLNNKVGASTGFEASTDAVFRDISAWYHIFISFNGNLSTHNDRAELYVNGVLQSWSGSGTLSAGNGHINLGLPHAVGYRAGDGGEYFDGYIAEMYFIDGNSSLSHTDFGEFDEDSGIWKPKQFSGSYGTNGFKLDFSDSGSLGADSSPNSNSFTPTNLASTDQMLDTPTNNFCTVNALDHSGCTFSEGNLKLVTPSAGGTARATFGMSTGKWYWEVRATSSGNYGNYGILRTDDRVNQYVFQAPYGYSYYGNNGNKYNNNTAVSYGSTFTNNDIIGISYDADAGDLEFFKNGVSQGTAYTGLTGTFAPAFSDGSGDEGVTCDINFGQNGSFNGTVTAQGNSDANGIGDFYYSVPSNHNALCTQNLATALSPTIDDGSAYFQATTYTGDGLDNRQVTNGGNSDLQPDLIWVKNRTQAYNHIWQDTSRGLTTAGYLTSNGTQAESGANTTLVKTATSDGFTVGTSGAVNWSGDSLVAWQWKANGGTTSSNTDGSITSTVQANTTAGFSIVTFTGTGSVATVGHGLGKAPAIMIFKNRDASGNYWRVYHQSLGATKNLVLNGTFAQLTETAKFNNTEPTSSVFTVGTDNDTNASSQKIISYCFAEIEGYSKFGSYTGNGSTDGTFVYTGFRPAFTLIKRTNSTSEWPLHDNGRNPYNVVDKYLWANLSDAEGVSNIYDRCSNGFKLRGTSTSWNASGSTYIYIAFAENPFVTSSGVPVTAR